MRRPFCTLAAIALGVASPIGAAAQDPGIDAAVERYVDQIIEMRHQIHENPELGNREFETAALVAAHLRSLGFDEVTTDVAHTGVVGILIGGLPGDTVAVRADMDALPVTEETGYDFASTVRTEYLGQEVGVMHACGHDIHVAVQLGVASVLASMRDEIPGVVKFIFQPAEEGPPPGEEGGADLMVREGVLDRVRREMEACEQFGGFLLTSSMAGGTGSGVGSYVAEALREEHGSAFMMSAVVVPYESGEVIVQDYNALLSLNSLHAAADAIVYFENEQLSAICANGLQV